MYKIANQNWYLSKFIELATSTKNFYKMANQHKRVCFVIYIL